MPLACPVRAAALATCFLLTATNPAPPLAGTYHADCAPYDGAAFRITLVASGRRQLELTANVALAAMAGRWQHAMGSSPGSAVILLCRTNPERNCTYPQSGSFTVAGTPGRPITGTFDALFDGGSRLSGTFRARPAPLRETLLCG